MMVKHRRAVTAVLVMLCVTAIIFSTVCIRNNVSSAEQSVHCYIVIEPKCDRYYYGDIITMTAIIEEKVADSAATPTDLKHNGEWSIVWQRNDNDCAEDDWYDVGTGCEYKFILDHDTAFAWYRFEASRDEYE